MDICTSYILCYRQPPPPHLSFQQELQVCHIQNTLLCIHHIHMYQSSLTAGCIKRYPYRIIIFSPFYIFSFQTMIVTYIILLIILHIKALIQYHTNYVIVQQSFTVYAFSFQMISLYAYNYLSY